MSGKILAIIVAGGRGTRMSAGGIHADEAAALPKQYMMLGERCIVDRTVEQFTAHPQIDNVMVVIHHDDQAIYDRLVMPRDNLLAPVIGGPSRRHSVH